jgi:hypothetical protein
LLKTGKSVTLIPEAEYHGQSGEPQENNFIKTHTMA